MKVRRRKEGEPGRHRRDLSKERERGEKGKGDENHLLPFPPLFFVSFDVVVSQ